MKIIKEIYVSIPPSVQEKAMDMQYADPLQRK